MFIKLRYIAHRWTRNGPANRVDRDEHLHPSDRSRSHQENIQYPIGRTKNISACHRPSGAGDLYGQRNALCDSNQTCNFSNKHAYFGQEKCVMCVCVCWGGVKAINIFIRLISICYDQRLVGSVAATCYMLIHLQKMQIQDSLCVHHLHRTDSPHIYPIIARLSTPRYDDDDDDTHTHTPRRNMICVFGSIIKMRQMRHHHNVTPSGY